jgi:hypothetical protein
MRNPEKIIFYFFPLLFTYIAFVGLVIPKGSIATKIIGVCFFLILIYICIRHTYIYNFKLIYSYLIFVLVLCAFSSKLDDSIRGFIGMCTGILMFIVSFTIINNKIRLKMLLNSLGIVALLYLLNILIANFFKLGGTPYSEDGLHTGNVFTEGLNSMAYIVITFPLFIYFHPKRKTLIYFAVGLLIILIIVQLKRISIIAMSVGLIFYIIFYKEKTKSFVASLLILLVFGLLFPLFENKFNTVYKERESKLKIENYKNEGRYTETSLVFNMTVNSNKLTQFLFGKEVFNSPGNYNNPLSNKRQIHSDYNLLLHGTGVFGILFYFILQLHLLLWFYKLRKELKDSGSNDEIITFLNYLFPAVFFMGLVIMISGGINSPLFNSIRYAILGSSIGYMFKLVEDYKKNQNAKNHAIY